MEFGTPTAVYAGWDTGNGFGAIGMHELPSVLLALVISDFAPGSNLRMNYDGSQVAVREKYQNTRSVVL